MRNQSLYLDWYIKQQNLTSDLRSSGITSYLYEADIDSFDLGVNYHHGNPKTAQILAQRYNTNPENIFLSSEGTSGQNARIIRLLAETYPQKNEAIIEYPTYEPLLRLLQEYYPKIHQIQRLENDSYQFDLQSLKKTVTDKTGLLVITNPHAPSGNILGKQELQEIMTLAKEKNFYVLCDEIYAEFDRTRIPSLFSLDCEYSIVTTSFTKAYGLGGLKLGIALADKKLVNLLYTDMLTTVGNSSNLVEHITTELFTKHKKHLEKHQQQWKQLKKETEQWLNEKNLEYYPNPVSITYWVTTPISDTYTWTNHYTIPRLGLATVPGTFFLFKNDYKLQKTNKIRLGLGKLDPDTSQLTQGLKKLSSAFKKQI